MGIGADGVALEEKEEPLAVAAPCSRTLEVVRGTVRGILGKVAAEQLYGPRRGWPGGLGAGLVAWGRGD